MMSRLKHPFLLSALTALIFYFGFNFKTDLPKVTSKDALEKLNDLHITQLKVQFFDTAGHETHALTSPKLEHMPHHDTYLLQAPHLTFTPMDKPHWRIDSDEAIATERGQKIVLSHHVVLRHAAFQTHPKGRIETEKLTFYPKTNYAMTDEAITWKQRDNRVFSEGMKAYLNENRVDLFQAKAIYEPTT